MNRAAVRVARAIYKATPVRRVRQLYFDAFCHLMRHRQVQATIRGVTFDLDLGEMIDVALYLEQYEPDVTAALARYCRPGMVVLDIGANIGAHTLALGRLVQPGGAVYGFEPTEFAYSKLQRNLQLNPNMPVQTFRVALSDHAAAAQRIAYRSSWTTSGGRRDAACMVDFVRLDDWCVRSGVDRVHLIKIDVDGNEFAALSGGIELLRRSRPVLVMEAVWPHFKDANRNPFVLLERIGYRFFDTTTEAPHANAAAVGSLLPPGDDDMTRSFNVIAKRE